MSAASKTELGDEDKRLLLKLARATLASYLTHHEMPEPETLDVEITSAMKTVMGGFVTLTKGGDLRGCIGEIEPRRPLFRVVMDHAVDAAINDPRFPPVGADELASLRIEISVLTPPHPVASYRDIVIGKHGMTIEKGFRQAVFLPQVAPEQGWDLEETLTHLATKAGLPADAWKEGASFQVFEAVVFHEDSA
jgi:AmmeMemoRadiSam system protein A